MNGSLRARKFKRLSAYVAQEDVFEPTLSATETLELHAHLRLPNSTSRSERRTIVTEALQAMGLARSARTQVGLGSCPPQLQRPGPTRCLQLLLAVRAASCTAHPR